MQKISFKDMFGLTDLVLSGQKTQTRSIISQKLVDKYNELLETTRFPPLMWGVACTIKSVEEFLLEHSPYHIGEIVAVAMSYKTIYEKVAKTWEYAEEYKREYEKLAGWNNKMFTNTKMPFATIKITNIRVERLQDISDEDCLKEGILKSDKYAMPYSITEKVAPNYVFFFYKTPKEAFAALIDKINGKGTWESNPYVFVYDFELVK